jgi:LemA protein
MWLSSPLYWIVVAIVLFWALGAYNRLMRLRSAVVQAFGGFDAHMVRLLALLGEFSAAQEVLDGAAQRDSAALQGASTQLGASLAVARARPLQPEAMAALSAARDVLQTTWYTAMQGQHDSVWQARWSEHAHQDAQAVVLFNGAVEQYNAAVAQFPASLLARVFGFHRTQGL